MCRFIWAPEIVNTDKGSQYTTADWEELLKRNGIRISMDGKGRCKDNIWIERFWRSIKQDYIYTHPTDDVMELRNGIDGWIRFYNYERPHQRLGGFVPSATKNAEKSNCLTVKKLRPL